MCVCVMCMCVYVCICDIIKSYLAVPGSPHCPKAHLNNALTAANSGYVVAEEKRD